MIRHRAARAIYQVGGHELVEIADSYTLIMRDQPQAFADSIRRFVRETEGATAPA
jgi:hypothetical protein